MSKPTISQPSSVPAPLHSFLDSLMAVRPSRELCTKKVMFADRGIPFSQHFLKFLVFEHFGQDFLKENLIDHSWEKFCSLTKEQQNLFLIQEFENMLSEISFPVKDTMDLFVKDIMRDDYVVEKFQYRKRKNILMTYRGLRFLLERRFETLWMWFLLSRSFRKTMWKIFQKILFFSLLEQEWSLPSLKHGELLFVT